MGMSLVIYERVGEERIWTLEKIEHEAVLLEKQKAKATSEA